MPKLLLKTSRTEEFTGYLEEAKQYGETNDCTVRAVSVVTGVDYGVVRTLMAEEGRKSRRGAYFHQYFNVIRKLGYIMERVCPDYFINQYPKHYNPKSVTTYQIDKFNHVWKDGNNYLVRTDGHILGVRNGEIVDWTKGRAKRAIEIWKVTRNF